MRARTVEFRSRTRSLADGLRRAGMRPSDAHAPAARQEPANCRRRRSSVAAPTSNVSLSVTLGGTNDADGGLPSGSEPSCRRRSPRGERGQAPADNNGPIRAGAGQLPLVGIDSGLPEGPPTIARRSTLTPRPPRAYRQVLRLQRRDALPPQRRPLREQRRRGAHGLHRRASPVEGRATCPAAASSGAAGPRPQRA